MMDKVSWKIESDSPGIFCGGEFHQAKNGLVEIPGHFDLSHLGYIKVQKPVKKQDAKKPEVE